MNIVQELRTALAGGDSVAVLSILFDLEYLEGRCRASIADLLADLAYVLRDAPAPLPADASFVHPSGARLGRHAVAILDTLLTVHRGRLQHRPERLFGLLHDELYWSDAPARADHHDGPLTATAIDRELWRWAEHARERFEARAGAGWLRRLRPPRCGDAAVPSRRHVGEVRDVSSDGASALVEVRGELHLIDARTGRVRNRFTGSDRGRFSPDGAIVLTSKGATATLWASDATTRLHQLAHPSDIQRVVFSGDGRLVFTMTTKELRAWRVADGSFVKWTTSDYVESVRLCGAGAVVFYERGLGWQRWDGATSPTRASDDPGSYHVFAVSPAGDRLVQQRVNGDALEGWQLLDGRQLFQVTTPFMMRLAFHPTGVSFAGTDGILRDATTGSEIRRLAEKTPHPSFDPLGRFLLTRDDNGAWLRELAAGTVVARIEVRPIGDFHAYWSRDGSALALNEIGSSVFVDLAALAPAARWRDDDHPVGYYARARFSPSGATLVVDHEDGIGFWDTARGVIRTFAEGAVYLGTFAAGCCLLGRHGDALIAYAIEDGVELWRTELPRGDSESSYAADEGGVVLLAQSTPSRIVALDIDNGTQRYELAEQRVALCDRDLMVTRTRDDRATVRATETGAVRMPLPAQTGLFTSFAISPDHRWLAAYGNRIELWDLKTGTLFRTIATEARSAWFRDDSAAVIARDWQTQQSGNQDWNSEEIYEIATGACIGSRGWWDQESEPDPPRELAPGIVLDGSQLRVAGGTIELPIDPIVCQTERGDVVVASVFGRRLELYALKPGRQG